MRFGLLPSRVNPTKLREGAEAMTLRETVAAGSGHLTRSRREPGGGPHGGGGRHAFDDISSGLRPSAAHFGIAPLVIFLNFSLLSPLHVSLTLWRRIECLLPRPKYLAMRGRSRPCSLGSSGPRHLREVCVCVCACVRVCVCVCVRTCECECECECKYDMLRSRAAAVQHCISLLSAPPIHIQ